MTKPTMLSTSKLDPEIVEVFVSAAGRGADVRLLPKGIRLRPRSALTAAERARLDRAVPGTAAAISAALTWRVTTMRGQVPTYPAPIPALVARHDVQAETGLCLSCAEPSAAIRCPLCALAAWIAVSEYHCEVRA